MQWWSETPVLSFSDLSVDNGNGRTVCVLDTPTAPRISMSRSRPGSLPIESEPVVLKITGIDVDIPVTAWPSTDPMLAGRPQLPDLIHAKISNDPLPASTIGFGSG